MTGVRPRERGVWDSVRLSRLLRRLALPVVLLAFFLLYINYGVEGVKKGMDTLPESAPEGSFCAIQRRPSVVRKGSLVFLEIVRGADLLLSKVSEVLPDGRFHIRHENRNSAYSSYEAQGPFELSQVRGLVLGVFRVEGKGSDGGR